MAFADQRQRELFDMAGQPAPRVLVGEGQEAAHQVLAARHGVLARPRAVCCARHARSIASNMASSGRNSATPDTNSRRAAPARSPRPTPPSNRSRHPG